MRKSKRSDSDSGTSTKKFKSRSIARQWELFCASLNCVQKLRRGRSTRELKFHNHCACRLIAVDASEFVEGTVEIDSSLPVMKYEKVRTGAARFPRVARSRPTPQRICHPWCSGRLVKQGSPRAQTDRKPGTHNDRMKDRKRSKNAIWNDSFAAGRREGL